MKSLAQSYLGVNYELRPAKQVERRMIIDALHTLSLQGLQIRDYQYTGFGSVYFVDFVLFHRLLGIQRMLSVEADTTIEKRVRFNKPFKHIDIEMVPAGDVIPALSRDLRHLLWLDYDDRLLDTHLSDVRMAAFHLSRGSIILVTVDVEPPGDSCSDPQEWYAYYQRQAGNLFDEAWNLQDFAAGKLPGVTGALLARAIDSGLAARPEIKFWPLFKFLYADGHQMLTLGGMLGGDEERRLIDGSKLNDACYMRLDPDAPPYEIRVPKVTRKERLYLDQHMPCCNGWHPPEFEFSADSVEAYREIYRFFPAYAELLL